MPPSPDRIRRFSSGERWIHLSLGVLMGICILTAAILYWGPLSTLVGRRETGGDRPLHQRPAAAAAPDRRRPGLPAFRADVRRLNRFLPGDGRWLRSSSRRSGAFPSGKFNAGQKLNSAFVLAP